MDRLEGTLLEDIVNRPWVSIEDLIDRLKKSRYLDRVSSTNYHTHTFWIVWEDDDFGSNQMVFNSIGELVDFMNESGASFTMYEGPFIVEEESSYRKV